MMTKKQQVLALKAAARLNGCLCDPEVTFEAEHNSVAVVRIAHDGWCPHRRDEGSFYEKLAHELRRRNGVA